MTREKLVELLEEKANWSEIDGDCKLLKLQELFAKIEKLNGGNSKIDFEKLLHATHLHVVIGKFWDSSDSQVEPQ